MNNANYGIRDRGLGIRQSPQPERGALPPDLWRGRGYNWLLALWDNAQAVDKIAGNHKESGVSVDEQLYLLAAAAGACKPCRYTK